MGASVRPHSQDTLGGHGPGIRWLGISEANGLLRKIPEITWSPEDGKTPSKLAFFKSMILKSPHGLSREEADWYWMMQRQHQDGACSPYLDHGLSEGWTQFSGWHSWSHDGGMGRTQKIAAGNEMQTCFLSLFCLQPILSLLFGQFSGMLVKSAVRNLHQLLTLVNIQFLSSVSGSTCNLSAESHICITHITTLFQTPHSKHCDWLFVFAHQICDLSIHIKHSPHSI